MNHLHQHLVERFSTELRRSQIEHNGVLVDVLLISESFTNEVQEEEGKKVLRLEIYRTPVLEIPVEQVPKPNEYGNIDLIAWGRSLVKSGRLDSEIYQSLHGGGAPSEKPA